MRIRGGTGDKTTFEATDPATLKAICSHKTLYHHPQHRILFSTISACTHRHPRIYLHDTHPLGAPPATQMEPFDAEASSAGRR